MSESLLEIALTYGHILAAIAWLGAALMMNLTLGPLMARFSPSTRGELIRLFIPRFTRAVMGAAGGTVLFGLLLYGALMSDGTYADSLSSPATLRLTIGITSAVLAFLIGLVFVARPSFRLPKLLPDGPAPPGPEFNRTLRTVQVGSAVSLVLLLFTLLFMVAAAGA